MKGADIIRYFRGAGGWWLFVVYTLWVLWGAFPLMTYEGDSLSICIDCETAYKDGWCTLGKSGGYGYWMQPLTYVIVEAARHLGVPSEAFYSAFSTLCSLVFVFLSVLFIRRLTSFPPAVIILALWLIPESYMLAMYPNSTVPAMVCVMGALLCALDRRVWWTGVLLCFAALLRLDVVTVYPMLPFVLIYAGMSPRRSWIVTACVAVAVIVVIGPLYTLIGASASETLSVYDDWMHRLSIADLFKALFGFYGFVVFPLALVGIIILVRHRRWLLVSIIVVAMVSVHLAEARFGNAVKHFAPLIPFVGVAVAASLCALFRNRCKFMTAICIFAIIAPQLLGIWWFNDPDGPEPQFYPDGHLPGIGITPPFGRERLSLRLGSGKEYCTGDEVVTVGGYLFYPEFIRRAKAQALSRIEAYRRTIHSLPEASVLSIYIDQHNRIEHISILEGHRPDLHHFERHVYREQLLDTLRSISDAGSPVIIPLTESHSHHYEWLFRDLACKGTIAQIDSGVYIFCDTVPTGVR